MNKDVTTKFALNKFLKEMKLGWQAKIMDISQF